MGVDYNIIFGKGLLVRNLSKKIMEIPETFDNFGFEIITDGAYSGVVNNLFIPLGKYTTLFCGGYDDKWKKYGITNFLGKDKDVYNVDKIESYMDNLMEIYQRNNKTFCIQFCRTQTGDLPEEAYLLYKMDDCEKDKTIDDLIPDDSVDADHCYMKNILMEHAVYGNVLMKCYS